MSSPTVVEEKRRCEGLAQLARDRPIALERKRTQRERELTEAAANHKDHEVHPTSDNDLNRVNDQGDSKDSDKDASVTQ